MWACKGAPGLQNMVSVYVLDTLYEQTILIAAHYSSVTAKVKLERKKKELDTSSMTS
jgi:hypothetical protein